MRTLEKRLVILIVVLCAGNVAVWAARRPADARRAAARSDVADAVKSAVESSLPVAVGGWTSTLLPVNESLYEYLAADAVVLRRYTKADFQAEFWGVFGGDWRSIHSPRSCFIGTGWAIQSDEPVAFVTPDGRDRLSGNRIIMTGRGQRRVSVYMFATLRGTTHDWATQSWALVVGRRGGMGCLMQASAPAAEGADDEATRSLQELLAALYPGARAALGSAEGVATGQAGAVGGP